MHVVVMSDIDGRAREASNFTFMLGWVGDSDRDFFLVVDLLRTKNFFLEIKLQFREKSDFFHRTNDDVIDFFFRNVPGVILTFNDLYKKIP